ncbi:MAG: hypothetical protein Q7K65_04000 [Candidatus Buchananbacteria bacterium]|nr:hypothetical protein [Candidatus Buchananbacteria bacterium]
MILRNKNWLPLLLFFVAIILSYFFRSIFGVMSYNILNPVIGLGPVSTCPECVDGFILSYLFFITLLLNLVINKKYWLVFLLPIMLFINPPFGFLFFGILLIIIAWLLAQIILFLYKKIKK